MGDEEVFRSPIDRCVLGSIVATTRGSGGVRNDTGNQAPDNKL